MGQEPSLEIPQEDRPRAVATPAPARRWSASRPGDLHAPSDVPWGGPFGTPGPDTGYGLKLAAGATLNLAEDERRHPVERVLVLIIGARASLFGKAPSADDLGFAVMLLGLDTSREIPEAATTQLAAARRYWAPRVAHSTADARRLSARLTPDLLALSPDDLRHRLALGEVPLAP
ncbi:MAG: hypothetical protein OER12_09355 [Acidimicrobiia bacterium]|nr:hypothetical protein [Acidimicrobiia bacterium]